MTPQAVIINKYYYVIRFNIVLKSEDVTKIKQTENSIKFKNNAISVLAQIDPSEENLKACQILFEKQGIDRFSGSVSG